MRDFEMFRRKGLLSSAARSVAATTLAGLVITMAGPPMAAASSISPVAKGVSAAVPSSGAMTITTTAMDPAITDRRPSIMDRRFTVTVLIMAAAFIDTILTRAFPGKIESGGIFMQARI